MSSKNDSLRLPRVSQMSRHLEVELLRVLDKLIYLLYVCREIAMLANKWIGWSSFNGLSFLYVLKPRVGRHSNELCSLYIAWHQNV